jgi:molybdopterin-binding protein
MSTCLYQLETNFAGKLKRFSESVITRRSADELKLKKGDTVSAVVKATEVMIQKD